MKVQEIRHAAATCLETNQFYSDRLVPIETLVSSTRGLLIVDEETQLVRLVRQYSLTCYAAVLVH